MRIVVNDQVRLSEFRSSDKDALVAHLNDRDIYDCTLRIPSPEEGLLRKHFFKDGQFIDARLFALLR